MLTLILIALFLKIRPYIMMDTYCINRSIAIHNTVGKISKAIRPLKINIPILYYTLANLQYENCENEYHRDFFPINVSRKLIETALCKMSYRTNWVNGTGRYNIKSLKHIKNSIRAEEVFRISSTIYQIFQEEMKNMLLINPLNYYENSNKYYIEGYYNPIYSSISKEISDEVPLSLSTIISYSILTSNPAYCYNTIGWRSNVYKVFINKHKGTYLDCFSSPIYPTIKPYCSMLPQDTFFNGCVGSFSLDTLLRVRPSTLFCNPTIDPYTGQYCMKVLDKYMDLNPESLAIITTQCTLGKLTNYVDTTSTHHTMVASYTLNHCFVDNNKRTLGFFIIPINICKSSLIYLNNLRINKSDIEIETAYIMIFYGHTDTSLIELKKSLIERLRQNNDMKYHIALNTSPVIKSEIEKVKQTYDWTIDIHREMSENIRLLKSYF